MTTSSNVTIYHNPACGTSRNTLALIRNTGIEPTVIEYLITPPSYDELVKLIQDAKLTVREAIRQNVDPYRDLDLDRSDLSDEQLLGFMLDHPILINRPFVVTELGTRLSRPSEVVLDILPLPQKGAFTKEDGEKVIDENGQRVN
ncbi:TPA: arsenate reductase (glutaredoxin) [Acinetobacter baumannii]|jgi:arsenate reductase|uniref:Arsenate reductase n=1 Tax=Acinetobacter johnsonii TaxID=40214 RepID=A0AA42QMM1_ACIJO|nr:MULTISPECIES: arsenate reductase (glutaredoxin) [Acinetobacter]HDI2493172.1 arsenate reductase (glutaredoxin) [Acinetobacter baumannii]MDH1364683.1 arsenate reductase (glutaredoxin) [Acinetobacter johnsonii]MDH1437375.1 arsenate reductase (glutaredoxin) [Acinetobacter johnsonii]MDH1726067.1 arsenate reductase (glutaredoxin) [Acinetobacter johnsonii]MDP7812713.1 arsenate reductase (glutaredoxin) [Acinetobacter pittii]